MSIIALLLGFIGVLRLQLKPFGGLFQLNKIRKAG